MPSCRMKAKAKSMQQIELHIHMVTPKTTTLPIAGCMLGSGKGLLQHDATDKVETTTKHWALSLPAIVNENLKKTSLQQQHPHNLRRKVLRVPGRRVRRPAKPLPESSSKLRARRGLCSPVQACQKAPPSAKLLFRVDLARVDPYTVIWCGQPKPGSRARQL